MVPHGHPRDGPRRIDLHGLSPERALRRVAQELHASRIRREPALIVVTGRGWGNLRQEPILRPRVEAWLRTPEARSLGVRGHRVIAKGGALEIDLAGQGTS